YDVGGWAAMSSAAATDSSGAKECRARPAPRGANSAGVQKSRSGPRMAVRAHQIFHSALMLSPAPAPSTPSPMCAVNGHEKTTASSANRRKSGNGYGILVRSRITVPLIENARHPDEGQSDAGQLEPEIDTIPEEEDPGCREQGRQRKKVPVQLL